MQIFSKSHMGMVRTVNQDAYFAGLLSDGAVFAVVCDGMGGANAGNIASESAVKLISQYVLNSYRTSMDNNSVISMLCNAIQSANIEIYDMAIKDDSLRGMGTTAVVVIVRNNTAVFCHVGDSRIYLVNDTVTQLTRDHSIVQSLIDSGKITLAEAKVHPKKNVITRAIGAEENILAESGEIDLEDGNSILLCTDGLTNLVDNENILKIFKEYSIENVCDELINLANKNGGSDNITSVTVTL